jgi:hypothetical protein
MARIEEIARKARLTPYLTPQVDIPAYYLAIQVAREAERILRSRWWIPEDPAKQDFAESVEREIKDFLQVTRRNGVPIDLRNHLAMLIELCRE